jgi:hypothetical protein
MQAFQWWMFQITREYNFLSEFKTLFKKPPFTVWFFYVQFTINNEL